MSESLFKAEDRVKHKREGKVGTVKEVAVDAWNVDYAIVYWDGGFAVSAINLSGLEKL